MLPVIVCNDGTRKAPLGTKKNKNSNGASNNVTVVDLRGLRVQAIVPVGKSPTGLATNPDIIAESSVVAPASW